MAERGSLMSVFYTVAKRETVSRGELSRLTGYSLVSIGKAVDVLSGNGLVSEEKVSHGTVGRKATVCRINKSMGMLVVDLTGKGAVIKAYDLSLKVCGEAAEEYEDASAALMGGFGWFLEKGYGELLGIGCIVPDGTAEEYRQKLTAALGNPPDLIIEENQAWAMSHMDDELGEGIALYVRVSEDHTVSGVMMQNGKLYHGARGKACDFSGVEKSAEGIISAVSAFSYIADPETVLVAVENEDDRKLFMSRLKGADVRSLPKQDEIHGGCAYALREKYIFSKLTKNS